MSESLGRADPDYRRLAAMGDRFVKVRASQIVTALDHIIERDAFIAELQAKIAALETPRKAHVPYRRPA